MQAGELRVSGMYDLWQTAEALQKIVRPQLEDWTLDHPGCSPEKLQAELDRLVDAHLEDVAEPAWEDAEVDQDQ